MSEKKCRCGKDAIAIAYLPIANIYVRLIQVTESVNVCAYHAEKSKTQGYRVEYF